MTIQNYVGTSSLKSAIANILKLCPVGNSNKLRDFIKEACKELGLPHGKTGAKTPEQNLAIFNWLRDNKTTAINNVLIEAPEPAPVLATPVTPTETIVIKSAPIEPTTEPAKKGKLNMDDAITPPKFSLKQFSVKGKSKVMREKMQHDVFVLNGIALRGQLTVIYAKPNTGKTLLTLAMLKDSIVAGKLTGENIFYINADDSYKGAVEKLEIAENFDFEMIIPNEENPETGAIFKANDLPNYLQQLIDADTARETIIILDTLKKFTDLMDKKIGSNFMELARAFVLAGGTMIMLAHVNKRRSADGKVIAGGTSDIVDDCDCAYTLDDVEGDKRIMGRTEKTVLFENFKARGSNEAELLASYSIDPTIKKDYSRVFKSVKFFDKDDAEKTKKALEELLRRETDKAAIDATIQGIGLGNHKKDDLLKYLKDEHDISRRIAKDVIKNYASLAEKGFFKSPNKFWYIKQGDKNSQLFYLFDDEIDNDPIVKNDNCID